MAGRGAGSYRRVDQQPGAGADSEDQDLVEPEGVNAGSGGAGSDRRAARGDVVSGGSPERADEQSRPPPAAELLGPPQDDDEALGSEPVGQELSGEGTDP
jgi:hypothetical protein